MKKVFISYSFSKREEKRKLHNKVKKLLEEKFGYEVYAFVFDYKEKVDDKKLMKDALDKVNESDLIIIELSHKSVGVGIEAGYAKAKGKPIIYLHNKSADLKQTMNGIADAVVEYTDTDDLIKKLTLLELLLG